MTLVTMVWALKHADVPPDPIAHLVLIGLADHAHDDGTEARPSVATLAQYARCSERTVHTKLRLLESAGLIRRGDQRAVEHLPANRRPVVYDLLVTTRAGVNEVQANMSGPGSGVHGEASRGEAPRRLGVNAFADRTTPRTKNEGEAEAHLVVSPARDADEPSPQDDLGGHADATVSLLHPDRCPRHQAEAFPPPCGACGAARRAAEDRATAAARADALAARQERHEQAAARRQAIAACRWCDETGYVGLAVCTHRPPQEVQAERSRGAAAVREALRRAASGGSTDFTRPTGTDGPTAAPA